jgi:hypothetical protein
LGAAPKTTREAIEHFGSARQLAGRPIAISTLWPKKSDELSEIDSEID